jgi:hypothetical protein
LTRSQRHRKAHLVPISSGGYASLWQRQGEKVIEDNLPSVEVALADLNTAWNDSLKAEEKFKSILLNYI